MKIKIDFSPGLTKKLLYSIKFFKYRINISSATKIKGSKKWKI